MKYSIDKRNYFLAIDRAFEAFPKRAGSVGSEFLESLLVWVWDTIASPDLSYLPCLDVGHQELAFDLIIGRMQHGRPTGHPKQDELERILLRQFSKR